MHHLLINFILTGLGIVLNFNFFPFGDSNWQHSILAIIMRKLTFFHHSNIPYEYVRDTVMIYY